LVTAVIVTAPVVVPHTGWLLIFTIGAAGAAGCALIVIYTDSLDEHPTEFVAVNLYVPAVKPEIV
jgi:hypothetical protein